MIGHHTKGRTHSGRPAHCLAVGRDGPSQDGGYSRLFPDLSPLNVAEDALVAFGQPGAACDGTGVATTSTTAAGWPFFGQLIAHDITADRSVVTHDPQLGIVNARHARLDLECLYAGGPSGTVYLYDAQRYQKLLTGPGGHDLPRNSQGIAIIGDARNDSHFFMNRLHLALMHGHNTLVDRLADLHVADDDLFDAARQRLTWFYQWIIVNDYLPALVGADMVTGLLHGHIVLPSFTHGSVPLEFADAAFRYGHSQIRQNYQLQADGPLLPIFPDLIGFKPVPVGRDLDFRLIFDRPSQADAQRSMPISERMPTALIRLPVEITGAMADARYASLAARDLRRGKSTALPSGEDVAHALGLDPLDRETLGPSPASDGTPLLLYILREAMALTGGERLGPVGGRIVAGVLIGLLRDDPTSYLSVQPDWHPVQHPELGAGTDACILDLLCLSDTQPKER